MRIPLSALMLVACVTGCGGQREQFAAVGAKVGGDAAPAAGGKPVAAAVTRKIVYTAAVEVTVKDVDAARPEVVRIVADAKGYVAKTDDTGTAGYRRSSTWTVKVPVDAFRPTVDALSKLGAVARSSSDSTDITEEFIDVEARLANLKAQEESLRRLLATAGIEDQIKVGDRLAAVRTDIDKTEGRLKYLTQSAALSTIVFTAREADAYTPPDAPAAPGFADRAVSTLASSWAGLQNAAVWLALSLVALVPWLPVLLAVILLMRWGLKRLLRWIGRQVRWLLSPARPPPDPLSSLFPPPEVRP